MMVQRWDPFREMRWMRENMNQMRRGFSPAAGGHGGTAGWAIPLNVVQDEESIVVYASMPGIDPADLNVTVDNDVLTIRGQTVTEGVGKEGNYLMREMHTGTFQRSLRLPDTLDVDNAQSSYDNGVLTISLPKVEARQARQLPVTVGANGNATEGDTSEE